MLIKRREFLKISSLATASMLMPNFLKAMTLDEALNPNQNILVVLQFTGGNDGLNTIIPAKNDISGKGKHWHSGFNAFNG
jgi:uncharacterized protein (DUF1501 family)